MANPKLEDENNIRMRIEYFLGIDFGYRYTCVSRTPGYDGEQISRIALQKKYSDIKTTIVRSAIYRNKYGEWNFLSPFDCDFVKNYDGLKEPIAELEKDTPESFEALRVFGKLIFSAILTSDSDLVYDEKTGESNFIICIAYPSEWKRENSKANMEYLNFFKQECGIKPAMMCINESDAVFYSNIKYFTNDTAFVIDLGLTKIDFTTYNNTKCIVGGCWSYNHGINKIADIILAYGLENAQNKKKLKIVKELRKQKGVNGNLGTALSYFVIKSIEDFFDNQDPDYDLVLWMRDLVPGLKCPEATATAFEVCLEKEEFYNVISDYINQLELFIKNAAKQLHDNVIVSPKYVILSGGAGMMDFVKDLARRYFPNAKIDYGYDESGRVLMGSYGAANFIKHNMVLIDFPPMLMP